MMQSPMNLSSTPPCSMTAETISPKYSFKKETTSSGSMPSLIEVKPRMSENSTVAVRRSPPSSTWPPRI